MEQTTEIVILALSLSEVYCLLDVLGGIGLEVIRRKLQRQLEEHERWNATPTT